MRVCRPSPQWSRTTVNAPPRARTVRSLGLLLLIGLAALTLSACGSSSSASATLASAKQQGCTAVSDVLADGPDPDADSVGYAEAQILPLAQLKLTDSKLSQAVQKLDAAYKAYNATNGASAAAIKVSATEKAVNAICPDAAP